MRKNIFGKKLSRNKNQRRALFRGLMSSLILNGRLNTTAAKAKAIRSEVEKLINKAKKGGDSARLQSSIYPNALPKLLNDVSKRFAQRKGGYTRIIKLGQRFGDRAEMVILDWTEGPIVQETKIESKKKEKITKPQVKAKTRKEVGAKVTKRPRKEKK